jgi:hypothetical protein
MQNDLEIEDRNSETPKTPRNTPALKVIHTVRYPMLNEETHPSMLILKTPIIDPMP